MKTTMIRNLAIVAVALLGAVAVSGCGRKSSAGSPETSDLAERAGVAVDKAAAKAKDAAGQVVEKTGEALEKAGTAVEKTGAGMQK